MEKKIILSLEEFESLNNKANLNESEIEKKAREMSDKDIPTFFISKNPYVTTDSLNLFVEITARNETDKLNKLRSSIQGIVDEIVDEYEKSRPKIIDVLTAEKKILKEDNEFLKFENKNIKDKYRDAKYTNILTVCLWFLSIIMLFVIFANK